MSVTKTDLEPKSADFEARKEYDRQNMIAPWPEQFKKMGAIWRHDGNHLKPHVKFSANGNHGGSYFNSRMVTKNATILNHAATELVGKLRFNHYDPRNRIGLDDVDLVVGPAMGACSLVVCVALNITHWCGREDVEMVHVNIGQYQAGRKSVIFDHPAIQPGKRVLIVDDGLTTGGTTRLIAKAIERAGGIVLPVMLVMINSCGEDVLDGRSIISLVKEELPTWAPVECPLCAAGSEALLLSAQEAGNWALLTSQP
ncbi:MAG: phosphoribosyltransferase family protein [Candidatus Paceibacterota bacterium]